MEKTPLLKTFCNFIKTKHSPSNHCDLSKSFQELVFHLSKKLSCFLILIEKEILPTINVGHQDSLEFLTTLLQALDNDLNRSTEKTNSIKPSNFLDAQDFDEFVPTIFFFI